MAVVSCLVPPVAGKWQTSPRKRASAVTYFIARMPKINPGTYRIVNAASNTAIAAKGWETFATRSADELRQQWIVQHSGEGYRIKNVDTRNYLAISSTIDRESRVYCGRYPTTWVLNPDPQCNNLYLIQMGDTDRVLDLDGQGANHDGNQIHSRALNNRWLRYRLWYFEYLSDVTNDDDEGLKKKLAVNTIELAAKQREVAEKTALLADKDVRLRENATLLETRQHQLDQMRNQLAEAASSLSNTQEALTRAESLLRTKDAELQLLRQESLNSRVAKCENELAQQQQETADLRTKLETLELVVAEMARNQQRPQAPNDLRDG